MGMKGTRTASTAALALLLVGGGLDAVRAQATAFTANEVRATTVKDQLRELRATLKDQNERGKKLTAATSEAFRETPDWGRAVESYYGLRKDLMARAADVESRIDKAMAANSTSQAEKVRDQTAEVLRQAELLRSDYELYARLPALAAGPQRKAAQASMRLLTQTGKYPMALAYYLDKSTDRRPFAPLTPPLTLVRLPY